MRESLISKDRESAVPAVVTTVTGFMGESYLQLP